MDLRYISNQTSFCYDTTTTLYGWREMFYCIHPASWAYMGVAISLTFSIIGAAW